MTSGTVVRSYYRRFLWPVRALGVGVVLTGCATVPQSRPAGSGSIGSLASIPPLSGTPQPQIPTPASTLALRGVTVVDVTTGQLRADQTVVITGTRIAALGPAGKVRVPRDARVIDAPGRYLIPGLWDMHVHNGSAPSTYSRWLALGVTGLREMHTMQLDSVLAWRREVAAGRQAGPRLLTPGPYIHYAREPETGQYSISVSTPEAARRAVDSVYRLGVDFIKIYSNHLGSYEYDASRAVYFAIAREARRLGLPFAGHQPERVTMAEASDSGQRSIEHWVHAMDPCWGVRWDSLAPDQGTGTAIDSAGGNDSACVALAARLRRNQTWLTPTVVALWDSARPPAAYPAQWQDIVRRIWRFNMPLLAGSDRGKPGYGGGVVQELEFLVAFGLPPLSALQAATLNPAKYLHGTDSLGTIARGKLADLVLLGGNPLQDIHNLRQVEAVIANGRYFDRPALDGLWAQAQAGKEP